MEGNDGLSQTNRFADLHEGTIEFARMLPYRSVDPDGEPLKSVGVYLDLCQEMVLEAVDQNAQWGGTKHDDQHMAVEWEDLIATYGTLYGKPGEERLELGVVDHGDPGPKWRRRMIQTAALALQAAYWYDRKFGGSSGADRSDERETAGGDDRVDRGGLAGAGPAEPAG